MQLFMKRLSCLLAVTSSGPQPSHLFYVGDISLGLQLLVDTGAEISVIPLSKNEHQHPQVDFTL